MTCFVQNGQGETKLGICNQGDLTKSKSYERPINKILHTRTCFIYKLGSDKFYHFPANSLVGYRAC